MDKVKHSLQNPVVKICAISIMALLLLIPLAMVKGQVAERSSHRSKSVLDITKSWGLPQKISGPSLSYKYLVEKDDKDKTKAILEGCLYPDDLKYVVNTTSKELHRSIYDVQVYTADLTITGNIILDDKEQIEGSTSLVLNLSDLKGIQGNPVFSFCGKEWKVKSGSKSIKAEVSLPKGAKEGDKLPFSLNLTIQGSESMYFTPLGSLNEVDFTSDYPNPSFDGDFLPIEREIRDDGFSAKWLISQIAISSPSSSDFGVKMIKPVTQYHQTERATKYGILIIFLIFIAGFVVEMISKRPINLIQYLVIGASLVLFYSLLLAFSDFMSFAVAYLIASVMTTAALGGYFMGLVKNKWAVLLTALVAVAYGVIYILLQMETYAFLTGTLLLFVILCVIMFLTRNMQLEPAEREV
ncbi:MAG: cell envelope integrity protein CreD [Bacteroidales bacterium]|nr:cell envelope integrity protein CreD [Bacteroidales bacterium]